MIQSTRPDGAASVGPVRLYQAGIGQLCSLPSFACCSGLEFAPWARSKPPFDLEGLRRGSVEGLRPWLKPPSAKVEGPRPKAAFKHPRSPLATLQSGPTASGPCRPIAHCRLKKKAGDASLVQPIEPGRGSTLQATSLPVLLRTSPCNFAKQS